MDPATQNTSVTSAPASPRAPGTRRLQRTVVLHIIVAFGFAVLYATYSFLLGDEFNLAADDANTEITTRATPTSTVLLNAVYCSVLVTGGAPPPFKPASAIATAILAMHVVVSAYIKLWAVLAS